MASTFWIQEHEQWRWVWRWHNLQQHPLQALRRVLYHSDSWRESAVSTVTVRYMFFISTASMYGKDQLSKWWQVTINSSSATHTNLQWARKSFNNITCTIHAGVHFLQVVLITTSSALEKDTIIWFLERLQHTNPWICGQVKLEFRMLAIVGVEWIKQCMNTKAGLLDIALHSTWSVVVT